MTDVDQFQGLGDEALWLCPTLDDSPNDLSENQNHGVYRNGLTTEPETQFGGVRAYRFTLNGQEHLEVPHHPAIDFDEFTSFTMGGWFRMERTSGTRGYMGKQHPTSPFRGYHGFYSSNTRLELNDVSTRSFNFTGSGRAPNVWTCIYIEVDRDTQQAHLYYDGGLFRSVSITSSFRTIANEAPFYVGSKRGTTNWFEGWIDDARVFRRKLTLEEHEFLASGRGVLGSPGGQPVQVIADVGITDTFGLAPAVSVGGDVIVGAATGRTSTRGQQPTPTVVANLEVITAVGVTDTKAQTPTSATTRNITATPTAGRTSTRGQQSAPTVGVIIEADAGRTATIGQTPTPVTDSDVAITADVGVTDTKGLIPAVQTGGDISVGADVGATDTIGQTPTITLTRNVAMIAIAGRTHTRGQKPTVIPVGPRRGRKSDFILHPV